MKPVKITPRFQVTIPKDVRKTMNIKSGMEFMISSYGNHIEMIPLKRLTLLQGTLKGINTTNIREKTDRI